VRTQKERTGRDWLSLTLLFSHAGHEPLHSFPTAPPALQTSMAGSCTVTRQRPEIGNRHVAFPLIPGRLERQPRDHLGAWHNSKPWAIMNQGFEGINLPSDLFKVETMQLSRQCSHGASNGYLNMVPSSTVTKKPRRHRKPDQHGASSTLKPRCPVIVEAFSNLESS
jgi:hypothetical protein